MPVAPVGKVLPFLPVWSNDDPVEGAALDAAAKTVLTGNAPADELRAARVWLAERRKREMKAERCAIDVI